MCGTLLASPNSIIRNPMSKPILKYADHPDRVIRFIEWKALEKHFCKPNGLKIYDVYPEHENSWYFWQDAYSELKAKAPDDKRLALLTSVLAKAASLDEAYSSIEQFLKPRLRGRELKQAKKRVAQKDYQEKALGDAYIDNPPLVSAAKKACEDLAMAWADEVTVVAKAEELERLHCTDDPLSDEQRKTLIEIIMLKRIRKLQTPSRVEAALLDEGDKILYFLWGQIKRHCAVGETITLSQKQVTELGQTSATKAKPLVAALIKHGALVEVSKSKTGQHGGRAGIYRRLV